MNSKSELSERDIITKYILPAIEQSGWNKQTQIREEVTFTAGRIFVKGRQTKRGEKKRADIILYYKPNIPVAVIEAKDNTHSVGSGLQQALGYAETLDIPVAISSNGDGFVIQYRKNCGNLDSTQQAIITQELDLNDFPTPEELWACYKRYNGLDDKSEQTALSQYFFGNDCYPPRYYQRIAVNRTVEAIARGQKRILLVMATGTGKTFTAFQIIYRLWKSGCKKRILYLADRNNLITQTKKGDFKHFKDKLTIIKNKKIDKSYEIYLALYQGLTNYNEETYGIFDPNEYKYINEEIPKDAYCWLKNGDFLIERSNSVEYVGICAIYTGKNNEFMYPDLLMRFRTQDVLSKQYIHTALISPFNRSYFMSKAKGAQKTMPKINQECVVNTMIPLPPIAEQKEIVTQVEKYLQSVSALKIQITERIQLTKQIMQNLLKEKFYIWN